MADQSPDPAAVKRGKARAATLTPAHQAAAARARAAKLTPEQRKAQASAAGKIGGVAGGKAIAGKPRARRNLTAEQRAAIGARLSAARAAARARRLAAD